MRSSRRIVEYLASFDRGKVEAAEILRPGDRRLRIEQPPLLSLDHKGRQNSGAVGSRVDPDAIGSFLHPLGDRMTVNDHETVVGTIAQKWFADPPQIELTLAVKGNAGPHARVDKEIVAEVPAADEVFKEFHVVLGDGVANASESLVLVEKRDFGRINSVALEAFGTTKAEPVRD